MNPSTFHKTVKSICFFLLINCYMTKRKQNDKNHFLMSLYKLVTRLFILFYLTLLAYNNVSAYSYSSHKDMLDTIPPSHFIYDCPSLFTIENKHNDDGSFHTGDTLISDVIVDSGLIINYQASKDIILNPGFEASQGVNFVASIDQCIPQAAPKYFVLIDTENDIISLDSSTLKLASSTIEDSLVAGVYIVSAPQEFLPEGFLGQIVSKSIIGNEIILETKDAKITDFIKDGAISGTIEFDASDIEFDSDSFVTTKPPLEESIGLSISKSVNISFLFGNDTLKINGNTNLTFSLIHDLIIEDYQVKKLKLGISTDADGSISMSTQSTDNEFNSFSKDQTLRTIKLKAKVIWLPTTPFPIPIVVKPVLLIKLTANGNVAFKFSTSASAEINGINAVEYDDGNWNVTDEANYDSGAGVNFKAEGALNLGLGAEYKVQFYNYKNVSLNLGAGLSGKAEGKIDFLNGEINCSVSAGPKFYANAKMDVFGFKRVIEASLNYDTLYQDSLICNTCSVQLTDSTANQANTDGIFDLRVKVTSTCGGVPAPNYPVIWTWTVDNINYLDTTSTDLYGFAELNWTVPSPRIVRGLMSVSACADNSCRTIYIKENKVSSNIILSRLGVDCDSSSNNADITGNFGFDISGFQQSYNFNGSSLTGIILNESIPVYYSIGNQNSYPNVTIEPGNIFYNFNLTSTNGFLGHLTFHLSAPGLVIKDIEFANGSWKDTIGVMIVEYINTGYQGANGVTIKITSLDGVCRNGMNGGGSFPLDVETHLPDLFDKENEDTVIQILSPNSSNDFNDSKRKLSETQQLSLQCFPNPVSKELTLINPDFSTEDVRIEIVDVLGRTWIRENLNSFTKSNNINISKLPIGRYLIRGFSEEKFYIKSIIVIR